MLLPLTNNYLPNGGMKLPKEVNLLKNPIKKPNAVPFLAAFRVPILINHSLKVLPLIYCSL